MAQAPAGAKTPKDHQKKRENEVDEVDLKSLHFTYIDDDGNEVTFEHATRDRIRPGFFRKNRGEDPTEIVFRALEAVATEAELKVLDDLDWDCYQKVLAEFDDHFGLVFEVSAGESSAS